MYFYNEKERQLLHSNQKEEWLLWMAEEESKGTSFGAALVIAALGIAGFFTFLLTWIPAFFLMAVSIKRQAKKYLQKNRTKLERLWDIRVSQYHALLYKEAQRKDLKEKGILTCPNCISDKVEVFAQNGYPKMVCKMCGKIFNPGE